MSNFITLSKQRFELVQFRNDFVLLRPDKSDMKPPVFAIGEAIYERHFPFIKEVIATETEICLKLNDKLSQAHLKTLDTIQLSKNDKGNLYDIPVWFNDSEDWSLITEQTHKSKKEIIKQLLCLEFDVAMFGFLPGFVYMNGLPQELHIPRKSTPSTKMQRNTLAIGGPYLGIYSLPSPGGWNAIGRIACNIFDKDQTPPMLMSQNDKFKLIEVDNHQYDSLIKKQLLINQL